MTLTTGTATRLSILMHVDAHWNHRPLSDEIIERALRAGLAGASRFHGVEGYGDSGVLHSAVDPDVMGGLPCEVVIVDPSGERIRGFLPQLDEILDHGLVVVDTVEVVSVRRPVPPADPRDG